MWALTVDSVVSSCSASHVHQLGSSTRLRSTDVPLATLGNMTWSTVTDRPMTTYCSEPFDPNMLLPYIYCFIKKFVCASGTSTVAIDNKIEQAMDLVKSHLMFAVREEVEVLKERIAELMERISHLEYENTILRTSASPETLAQLQSTTTTKSINQSNPNVNT